MANQPKEARRPRDIKRPLLQRIAIFFRQLMAQITSTSDSASISLRRSVGLLSSDDPFDISLWRERVSNSKDIARSLVLVEARLYKNEHNVEHELIIAEFRTDSEVFFVSAERVTNLRDTGQKTSDEECQGALKVYKAEMDAKEAKKRTEDAKKRQQENNEQLASKPTDGKKRPLGKGKEQVPKELKPKRSRISISSRLSTPSMTSVAASKDFIDSLMRADDKVCLILGVQDFDAAVKKVASKRKSKKTTFISRGSLKYRFDTEPDAASPSVSGDPLSAPSRPNLLNFTSAIAAIQRLNPWYTVGHANCYWFATAVMFILSRNFPPSEPIVFDTKQGTWSFGVINIPFKGVTKEEEVGLVSAYERTMQEMEIQPVSPKTDEEIQEEQRRHNLEQQLNEYNQLAQEAKGEVSQAKSKEADARVRRAQADTKVIKAEAQAASKAKDEEHERDRLAGEAALKAKDEEHERDRLAGEAALKAEQSENKRLLQQLQALQSVNAT